jgi:phage terminase large subunit-like protein
VPYLKEAGWFAMGMLFGIGRGDFIVAYLDKRDGIDYDELRKQAEEAAHKDSSTKAQIEKSDPEKSESDKSE